MSLANGFVQGWGLANQHIQQQKQDERFKAQAERQKKQDARQDVLDDRQSILFDRQTEAYEYGLTQREKQEALLAEQISAAQYNNSPKVRGLQQKKTQSEINKNNRVPVKSAEQSPEFVKFKEKKLKIETLLKLYDLREVMETFESSVAATNAENNVTVESAGSKVAKNKSEAEISRLNAEIKALEVEIGVATKGDEIKKPGLNNKQIEASIENTQENTKGKKTANEVAAQTKQAKVNEARANAVIAVNNANTSDATELVRRQEIEDKAALKALELEKQQQEAANAEAAAAALAEKQASEQRKRDREETAEVTGAYLSSLVQRFSANKNEMLTPEDLKFISKHYNKPGSAFNAFGEDWVSGQKHNDTISALLSGQIGFEVARERGALRWFFADDARQIVGAKDRNGLVVTDAEVTQVQLTQDGKGFIPIITATFSDGSQRTGAATENRTIDDPNDPPKVVPLEAAFQRHQAQRALFAHLKATGALQSITKQIRQSKTAPTNGETKEETAGRKLVFDQAKELIEQINKAHLPQIDVFGNKTIPTADEILAVNEAAKRKLNQLVAAHPYLDEYVVRELSVSEQIQEKLKGREWVTPGASEQFLKALRSGGLTPSRAFEFIDKHTKQTGGITPPTPATEEAPTAQPAVNYDDILKQGLK